MEISNFGVPAGSFEINYELIPENCSNKIRKREEFVLNAPETWEPIVYAANTALELPNKDGITDLSPLFEYNENIDQYLSKAKWTRAKLQVYGEYHSSIKNQHINYYAMPYEYFEIIKIHERFHALHHLTLDNTGKIWGNFANTSSFYKELLAQIFTYKYIEKHQPNLMNHFLELNNNQPFIYQTWKGFKHFSWNDTVNLYWEIRNRLNNNQPMGILGQICKIINTLYKVKQTQGKRRIGMSKFQRTLEAAAVKILITDSLWKKLKPDIDTGTVFPTIRKNEIHFYYRGGKIFGYDSSFKTHFKYASVIDGHGITNEYFSESDLKRCKLISNFAIGYERIKENCKHYSGIEALGVADIYHRYGYVHSNSDVVVLDIEVAFPGEGRIDILLFKKSTKQLQFVEAKHFSNSDLWSKVGGPHPRICSQIIRYNACIKKNTHDILTAYINYIDIVNKLFKLKLPTPTSIIEKTKLYIFGFDNNQKQGRLNNLILNRSDHAFHPIPIYVKGNPKDVDANNIF